MLSEQPSIDPSAKVLNSNLGVWTRAELEERFADFRNLDAFLEKYGSLQIQPSQT
jgi:hypothetical protein